jgi:phosphoribosylglycinamide formyltransferase-1
MAGKIRIGALVSGRGSNLQSIIDHCQAGKIDAEVAVVISNVEGAYALERAEAAGIATATFPRKAFDCREARDDAILETLQAHRVDLIVLAGYLGILSPRLIESYPWRIMNIHPSLLPAFAGAHGLNVHEAALRKGVKVAGCTVQFITAEVDAGPIIVQRCVRVQEDDTPETLSARVLEQEHEAYPEAIQLFAEGRLRIEDDGARVRVLPER